LGTSPDTASSTNVWTLGILVGGTAWWALARPAEKSAEWFQALYGVWLFIAPWVLGFAGLAAAAWNAWIAGVAVFVLAVWVIAGQAAPRAEASAATHQHLVDH
jgi:hypothetical protein